MKTIASFTVDHEHLLPGLYVSRLDAVETESGDEAYVTTFDIRMTRPNREPVMNTAELHTIEHLGATFLRNHAEWGSRIVYFGPMGCRTGCYLLVAGKRSSKEMLPLIREMFDFIEHYEGEIPGARPEQCGNYLDQNLPMARFLAAKYRREVLEAEDLESHLKYPE